MPTSSMPRYDPATGQWITPTGRLADAGYLSPEDMAMMAGYYNAPSLAPAGTTPGPRAPSQLDVLAGQRQKAIAANVGLSAGLGAAQIGLSLVPTAYDRYNRKRLDELETLQEGGRLGLSGAQRQQMEQELFDPVAAQAHAARLRQESLQASLGSAVSAADVTRAQREQQRAVSTAANQAGLQISRANLEEANAQLQEIEERTAYKGRRAGERLQQGAQAIGAMAPLAGQIQAANRVKGVDWRMLPPEEQRMAMALAGASPAGQYDWQALLAGLPR